MSDLPGIGIFGTTPPVYTLVPVLKEKGFRVEAIWGRTTPEAERTAQDLRINFYTSKIDDVVLRKDVGIIIVFSAPNLHSQICVKALGIGKHVVCDRPAGLNQTEALRMVQAAAYYPSLLAMVGYSLRFLPNMSMMKRLVAEKYLGQITLCDVRINCESLLESTYTWRCDSTMGGGCLALLGSHMVDLLSYLGLGRVLRVHANLRTLEPTTDTIGGIRQVTADDFAVIQLQLTGGTIANIVINSQMEGFSQEVVLCGTEGNLVACGGDLKGKRKKEKEEVLHVDVEDLNSSSDQQSSTLPKVYTRGLVRLAGFLKETFSLPPGSQLSTEPALFQQGLYVQSVIEALRKSSESRAWVKVVTMVEEGAGPESNSWSSLI